MLKYLRYARSASPSAQIPEELESPFAGRGSIAPLLQSRRRPGCGAQLRRKPLLPPLDRCGVLLLDDLGKAHATDFKDAWLYELLEHRAAHRLPLLWSANSGADWMITRFGPDRGESIVRRLHEFSEIEAV